MPSFIKDLYIISKDGIPLVEVFSKSKLDPNYLGAFLSALETFSKQFSGTDLRNINLGDKKLIMTPALEGNVYLVSQYDSGIKDKKINKLFKIISEFFEEIYKPKDITEWDGDIGIFDKFKERIDIYFKMYDL